MLTSRKKTLGLSFTRQAVSAAEVVSSHGRHRLVRAERLALTPELVLGNPNALGGAIRQMLRAKGFSASRCVIGLEAAHLLARDKRLPSAAAGSLADILRIAIEQDFASDNQELAFDYVPAGDGTGALIVAAPRRVVNQVVAVAGNAGLTVEAVTASAVAMAAGVAAPADKRIRLTLILADGRAELVAQSGDRIILVRRLAVDMGADDDRDAQGRQRFLGALEGELHRLLVAAVAETPAETTELLVWDSLGLEAAMLTQVAQRLGVSIRMAGFPGDMEGFDESLSKEAVTEFSAAALAVAGAGEKAPVLDFLHSRLSPRQGRKFGRLTVLVAVAAFVMLAAGVSLFLDWRSSQREIAQLQDRLADLGPSVQQARELSDKAVFARGWYDRRPRFLDCLREATLAFPEEGRIWTTSLVVREDMRMVLSGKSLGEETVLNLLDRLKSNPALAEVKPLYIRKVAASSQEVSFAISFRFTVSGAT